MTPQIRQSVYLVGTLLTTIIGLALVWGGIDAGAAEHLTQVITGFVALLGAGAPAIAASTVKKQRKDGTLDTVAPVDQVINGVQAVLAAQANAEAEVERVKTAVSDLAVSIPAVGTLSQQVIDSLRGS